jgi:hypothetical protein
VYVQTQMHDPPWTIRRVGNFTVANASSEEEAFIFTVAGERFSVGRNAVYEIA